MTEETIGSPTASAFQALSPEDPREVGGYRLYARLGAGGMGRVYLAYTPGGRPVALKVVRPEFAADPAFRHRFAQEVASAQRIHGLYTAQVVDAGTDDPTPWLATAFVPGPSLHQVIQRHGPLPERTALLLLAGVAEALQAVHAAGVIHRDLKPANVLLALDGPRVIDFGIARAADANPLTGTGLRVGSPGFMAPEQVLGRNVAPATDVFALGSLIAYTGSGTYPFGDGPEPVSLYRTVHEEPDLEGLSPTLRELVLPCLAKNPEDRPSTAQLIEAARHHPATGGELRFTDGWLPQEISSEIHCHTELPTTPAPPSPPTDILPPTHVQHRVASPSAPLAPADTRSRRRARTTSRRRSRTPLLTAAVLILGTAVAWAVFGSGHLGATGAHSAAANHRPLPGATTPSSAGSPTTTSRPDSASNYVVVYTHQELTSPSSDYQFDLTSGTVTQDSTTWYLGREAGAFYIPDDSDAYIPPAGALTLADCLTGLNTQPATVLPFTTLNEGSNFCVRAHGGQDVALIHVLATDSDDNPVQVSITHYHRAA